jgi:hypothetical protein
MSADDERREFFRIRDRIPVEFRSISREEFIKLQDTIRYNSTQVVDRLHELYFMDERRTVPEGQDQLYSYMQLINRKLDMIIEMLGKSQVPASYVSVHTDVSMSGSGIQLVCTPPLSEGEFVELKIIVPVFPYPKITCLCQVVRTEQGTDGTLSGQKTALKFMAINEKDQDILINYIFLKERQHLREKKETAS